MSKVVLFFVVSLAFTNASFAKNPEIKKQSRKVASVKPEIMVAAYDLLQKLYEAKYLPNSPETIGDLDIKMTIKQGRGLGYNIMFSLKDGEKEKEFVCNVLDFKNVDGKRIPDLSSDSVDCSQP